MNLKFQSLRFVLNFETSAHMLIISKGKHVVPTLLTTWTLSAAEDILFQFPAIFYLQSTRLSNSLSINRCLIF